MKILKTKFAKIKLEDLNVKKIDEKAKELNFNFTNPQGKSSLLKADKINQLINGVNINQLNRNLESEWYFRLIGIWKPLALPLGALGIFLAFLYQFDSCKPQNLANRFSDQIEDHVCRMATTNEELNVLIIPFNSIGEYVASNDLGTVLKKRLARVRDTFNINTLYCNELNVTTEFDRDSALLLLQETNADLIVYGNYLEGGCLNNTDSVCYNWLLSDKFMVGEFQENTNPFDFKLTSVNKLFEGHLQEKTDYVILYLAFLSYLKTNSLTKAIPVLEKLIANDVDNNYLSLILSNLYYIMGENNKALRSFDTYMTDLSIDIKHDSISPNFNKDEIKMFNALSGMPRSMILRQMGRTQEAINSMVISLELTEAYYNNNPKDSILFAMLLAGYTSAYKTTNFLKDNNNKIKLRLIFYKKAKELFMKNANGFNHSKHKIKALYSFGNLEKKHSQFSSSRMLYEEGIQLIEKLDEKNFLLKAQIFNELADLHLKHLKDCKQGIKYSKAAVSNLKKFSKYSSPLLADYYNGLATCYSFCDQEKKSMKAIDKAIAIIEENPDAWTEKNINYKLAMFYNNKAETRFKQNDFKEARKLNLKAINIYESMNKVDYDLVIVYNTGIIIESQFGNFQKVNEYSNKIKRIKKKYNRLL